MSKRLTIALSALPAGPGSSDLYLDSGGKVGIGATSPLEKLDVDGNIRISGDDRSFYFSGDNALIWTSSAGVDIEFANQTASPHVIFKSDGKVGIGTTAPASKLHVAGSITLNHQQAIFWEDGDNLIAGEGSSGNSYLNFNTSGNERMRINSSGNVGIGTTAPSQKLHVAGNAIITGIARLGDGSEAIPSYQFGDDTNTGIWRPASDEIAVSTGGSERMRINSLGNVGIGTTAPGATLTVAGSVSAHDATHQHEVLGISVSDETSDIATGTPITTFRMPYAMTLTEVRANVNTAPVGSTIIVNINEGGSPILSTKLTIDDGEETSTTAAVPAVISDTALADDAEITIDIDQVGSGTAGTGLKLWLIGRRA
jgi:hypothetical protein